MSVHISAFFLILFSLIFDKYMPIVIPVIVYAAMVMM